MSDKSKSTTETTDDSDRSPQVGALLRASRERVGEDLRNVSDDLCIRFLYIEAIEECRYDDLPGDTYAIGFIRSYAEHLGLDGEEVIRRYRMERASSKRLSDLSFPTPVPESGVPKGAIVLVGAVLAVLVYGGWYVSTTEDTILSDLIAPVPERLQHLVEEENKPAEMTEAAPEASAPTAEQNSETNVQNEPSVNSETQEALQANTAEAIAEATEAARDNIEDTTATVVEDTVEAADAVAETVTSETETVVQEVTETTTEIAEAAVEQVTEVAAEVTESATVSPEVVAPSEPTVTEIAEETPATPQTNETVQSAENSDGPTSTNEVTESEPNSATTDTSASAAASSSIDTEPTSEATATTEVNSAVVEESVTTPEPETQPVTQEISAEDLNALTLQAANGGPAPEPTSSPNVETASTPSTSQPAVSVNDASSGIVIRASDNSWVQVTDPSSGEILFTGLMAPGASFDVPARSGLLLDTGNAGAIDVIVNGTTAPKLGGVGDVRKGIVLDGARLIAGTAGN
jgi:cytoskeleton protein RodZ